MAGGQFDKLLNLGAVAFLCSSTAESSGCTGHGHSIGHFDYHRWEKVQAKHSWNANWIATSAITFRLQRHADHHLLASKPYQVAPLSLSLPLVVSTWCMATIAAEGALVDVTW